MMSPDDVAFWGMVGTWVASAATAAATVVVGGGLLIEMKRRRVEDHEMQRARLDEEWSHARLVDITFTARNHGGIVTIRNDGTGPIRRIHYTLLVTRPGGETPLRLPVTPQFGSVPNVGAHDEAESGLSCPELATSVSLEDLDMLVQFRDVNGHQWAYRCGDDQLERVYET